MAPSKTVRLKAITNSVFEIVDLLLTGESEDIEAEEYALSCALIPTKPRKNNIDKKKLPKESKILKSILKLQTPQSIWSQGPRKIENVFTKLDQTIPSTIREEINSLSDFNDHFKMSKTTLENLCLAIRDAVMNQYTYGHGGRSGLTPLKQILLTVWLLVTQESFSLIAKRFKTSKSSALVSVRRVCDALVQLAEDTITWPTESRMKEISSAFHSDCGIEGIVGVVDAIYIKIRAMEALPEAYKNSDGLPTVILQAVCDNDLMFIDCYAGQLGSNTKADVYLASGFHQKVLSNVRDVFLEDTFILGDLSYPLNQHLLTPYHEGASKEEIFNTCANKALDKISLAFIHLTSRFSRLNNLIMSRVDLVPNVLLACCVLHNMCIQAGDQLVPDEVQMNTRVNTCKKGKPCLYDENSSQELNRHMGILKRDNISNSLYDSNDWFE